jgi:putative transposase
LDALVVQTFQSGTVQVKVDTEGGIGLLTPVSVHNGTAGEIIEARQRVLANAYNTHPERFRRGKLTAAMPEPAWINKPADADRKEAVTQ